MNCSRLQFVEKRKGEVEELFDSLKDFYTFKEQERELKE